MGYYGEDMRDEVPHEERNEENARWGRGGRCDDGR